MASLGFPPDRGGSPISKTPSPPSCSHSVPCQLSDPVLAFIKAYRLRGNTLGLKQAVFSSFDAPSLTVAYKALWDYCKEDLELQGLTYHSRRGSVKRQIMDVVFADILIAFEKLDIVDKLPLIYCEANQLLRLPCLVPDPISKKLDSNSKLLDSLVHKVDGLPALVTASATSAASSASDSVGKCCSALDNLISTLKQQLDQFSSSVSSLSLKPSTSTNPSQAPLDPKLASNSSSKSADPKHHSYSRADLHDRSNNVILFGLPEASLLATKSAIDDMTNYLIGKSISY